MKRAITLIALVLACSEPVSPDPTIPRTQTQVITPTKAMLLTFQQLNADIEKFYATGGTISWIGVTYDSIGTPTLHISIVEPPS